MELISIFEASITQESKPADGLSFRFKESKHDQEAALDRIQEIIADLILQYQTTDQVKFRSVMDFLVKPKKGNVFRAASFLATLLTFIDEQIRNDFDNLYPVVRNSLIELNVVSIYERYVQPSKDFLDLAKYYKIAPIKLVNFGKFIGGLADQFDGLRIVNKNGTNFLQVVIDRQAAGIYSESGGALEMTISSIIIFHVPDDGELEGFRNFINTLSFWSYSRIRCYCDGIIQAKYPQWASNPYFNGLLNRAIINHMSVDKRTKRRFLEKLTDFKFIDTTYDLLKLEGKNRSGGSTDRLLAKGFVFNTLGSHFSKLIRRLCSDMSDAIKLLES